MNPMLYRAIFYGLERTADERVRRQHDPSLFFSLSFETALEFSRFILLLQEKFLELRKATRILYEGLTISPAQV
jgi:hypothetical protein